MVYEFTATDDTKYFFGLHLVSSDDYRYVLNAHGDVIALVSKTGSTVAKYYEYDAFGNEINPDASDTNPYRYCGEYYDFESRTIYLRARYYSPTHGRFTQVDTARDGLNWYAYCYNNPVAFVDPSGEIAVAAVSIFAVIDVVSGAVIATAVTAAAAAAIAATYGFVTKIVEVFDAKTDSFVKIDSEITGEQKGNQHGDDNSNYEDAKSKGEKTDNHKEVKQGVRGNRSLPAEGTPNSSTDLVDSDGEVKQRRYYGPDGKAEKDIDYKHPDNGTHSFPHEHNWDWSSGGNPRGGHS